VSYTLRGRLESRLVSAVAPLLVAGLVAAVVREWWPVELAALMIGVGLALDVLVYHRTFRYQPGWAAVPLGFVELGFVTAFVFALGIEAPLRPALGLFAGAWLLAQVLGHAVFPTVRLTYGEDGGELGRLGTVAIGAALAFVAFTGGIAWATAPPTVTLEAGVHRGPIVLDEAQTLVGEPGAVVEGGIVISADDVRVEELTVHGGETGILVEDAERVVLDDVTVVGATLDGIAARKSSVTIRDCVVRGLADLHTQAIDVSFAMMLPASRIEGCDVSGGAEGIAVQMAHVEVRGNVVRSTALRGISLNEMSMGRVEENVVEDGLGIGILCMDYSVCEIERNRIVGTRADTKSQVRSRGGYAIVAHYGSTAKVDRNALTGNARSMRAFVNSAITSP
jgi:nitrous oxidase accessory protein NosD